MRQGWATGGQATVGKAVRAAMLAVGCLCTGAAVSSAADTRPAPPAAPPLFQAGFAERDITPDIGSEAPGGYGKAYHRTLHDPCKVRAAVFASGQGRVALVGLDAIAIHRSTVESVRRQIHARTGIAGSAVLLGASHSHSSGPICGVMPGEYDHASDLVKKLAYQESTCADPRYLERVEKAIVEAVADADARKVEARAGVGRGREDQVAFNRRFRMRSGLSVTHPGQNNPDIIEPAGPVDPEVAVLGAWDTKGRFLGCVVNFACHATTSPGGISANYVYYLEKAIQGYYGKDAPVVFLNGNSGDVTQVDNRAPLTPRDPESWAAFVGGRVGAEALKVLLTMDRGPLTPVAFTTDIVELRRRAPDPARVKNALAVVTGDRTKFDHTTWTFAKEIVLLEAILAREPVVRAEVQAIQVGPVLLLTTPAEYFCEFGLTWKAKSGFPFTFPVSLANGCIGYVPTEEAFGRRGGGYETRLTSYSNLQIDAGTRLADAALGLARTFQPGAVPSRPAAPPFKGGPWTYGDVPPERH